MNAHVLAAQDILNLIRQVTAVMRPFVVLSTVATCHIAV